MSNVLKYCSYIDPFLCLSHSMSTRPQFLWLGVKLLFWSLTCIVWWAFALIFPNHTLYLVACMLSKSQWDQGSVRSHVEHYAAWASEVWGCEWSGSNAKDLELDFTSKLTPVKTLNIANSILYIIPSISLEIAPHNAMVVNLYAYRPFCVKFVFATRKIWVYNSFLYGIFIELFDPIKSCILDLNVRRELLIR